MTDQASPSTPAAAQTGARGSTTSAAARSAGTAAPEPAWRVLLAYARPHRRALLLGGVLSLATTATGLALPLVVRELIDNLGSNSGPVAGLAAVMAVLVLANAAIGALGSYVLHRTAESVVLQARHRLIGRLLRLRLSAVERHEPGDLMSRVTADTTLLREVTTDALVGGITSALALAATLVLMALLDFILLAVTLLALGLAVVVIGLVVPRIHRAARHAQESVGVMGAALERMFGAFRTVKASGAEGREGDRVRSAASEAWRGQRPRRHRIGPRMGIRPSVVPADRADLRADHGIPARNSPACG